MSNRDCQLPRSLFWSLSPRIVPNSTALLIIVAALSMPIQVSAQDPDQPTADQTGAAEFTEQELAFFENKVRPLLSDHCFECHGPESDPLEGNLSLASRKDMLTGGDTGAAIVPGKPAESLMIQSVHYDDVYLMPPDSKLPDEQIEILEKWIQMGAPWPADEDNANIVKEEFDIQQRRAEHWAWQPIQKPDVPSIDHQAWPADAIDRFVLAKLESAGLQPAKPASRENLIRRAYFDLIGLPPTPEQVQAFVDDESENAFETVIDELLASPHFGERWARHWMDLVRYAETYGHEFDYPIPYPHQYRDYLIRAFNADVPYRQLIEEHIAGDLLNNPRRHPELDFNESKLGTGFWHFGEAKHGAVDSRGEEAAAIDNQIDVMSKTFLGLTVACARCHDHKFDAISTADYYALYGFLQSSRRERMMLDPGRQIETAFKSTQGPAVEAQPTVAALSERLKTIDQKRVARYLAAATELAPQFLPASSAATVQGEAMKQLSVGSGTVENQSIAARGKFKWQGDQQKWWRDGKVGDQWSLEFEVPGQGNEPQAFDVSLGVTKAGDYGVADILIDDQPVSNKVDFYTPDLTSETLGVGRVQLKPGKHKLTFRLAEPNPAAIKRNMVGLDFVSLAPVNAGKKDARKSIQLVAEEQQLDLKLLRAVVDQIVSDAATHPQHPFYLLRSICNRIQSGGQFDQSLVKQVGDQFRKLQVQHKTFLENSSSFQDFNQDLSDDWTETGFAFDHAQTLESSLSAAGTLLQSPGTVSSGNRGKPFQGVLRSPTFELKHNRIHYRVKGHNVSVRLIVNGFFMDEYNALLFKDCNKTFQSTDQFTWQTQAGDLNLHVGNRAHLEIIDHGGGYVELDEIRFSNGANPPASLPLLKIDDRFASANEIDDWIQLSAAALVAGLQDSGQSTNATELTNWIVDSNLLDLCEAQSGTQLGHAEPDAGQRHVQFISERRLPALSSLAASLKDSQSAIRDLAAKAPAPMMALGMTDGQGEDEHVFVRGNHKNLGPVVPRRFLSALSPDPIAPPDRSGRLELVRKMTAPENPLTARVAVNRVWHHLLGRGIVETVDNFGVLGKQPTHPELLDHLAADFQQDAWSIKRLVKRIVMSRTYQMASLPNPATADRVADVDPDNLLLHRANLKRLEGEAIRDAMLVISGRFNPEMYGPSVPIHLTPFMEGRGRPGKSGPLDGDGRRSVYIAIRRNFLSPMMLAFDTPAPFNAVGKRNVSNVPAQALILMNSPLVNQLAEQWATRLVEQGQPIDDRIDMIYRQALSRFPTDTERQQAKQFLSTQADTLGLEDGGLNDVSLWKDLCHVIFNVKEFIFIQ